MEIGAVLSLSRYIKRLDGSIEDKLRVRHYIPKGVELVLDVGCAAGGVTGALAEERPDVHFHGIDIELPFIGMAQNIERQNVSFSHNWLADLQQYNTKYDVILFMSVLHEFYSYGKGITSVIKALCDAYELLNEGGVIVIRDMLRPTAVVKNDDLRHRLSVLMQVEQTSWVQSFRDTTGLYVGQNGIVLNDFMLHLLYKDNWDNEIQEKYMFWTTGQYSNFLVNDLDMSLEHHHAYVLPYVQKRWIDMDIPGHYLDDMYSTGLIVAKKG